MDRFIRRENIRRFSKMLREARDDAKRRLIKKLMTEEEQKELAAPSPRDQLPAVSHTRH